MDNWELGDSPEEEKESKMNFKSKKPTGENGEEERWERFPGGVGKCPRYEY